MTIAEAYLIVFALLLGTPTCDDGLVANGVCVDWWDEETQSLDGFCAGVTCYQSELYRSGQCVEIATDTFGTLKLCPRRRPVRLTPVPVSKSIETEESLHPRVGK